MLFAIGSHELKWGYILRWIFLARFGPILTKKVIEFRTNDSFICNEWPIIQLKFGIYLGSFVLVYNAFKYLPRFFLYNVCFCPKYPENAFFQHILEHYLVYYVFSLAVVLTFSHITYNLFFVLMDSFNDSDSHHFRVLYFCLTVCLGKCLLNNLSKVEWNRLNDSCAFPEIYRASQSISETALWKDSLLRRDIFLCMITASISGTWNE